MKLFRRVCLVQAAAAQVAVYIIISGYGLEVRVLGMKPDYSFCVRCFTPCGRVSGLFILEECDMWYKTKIARYTKNSQPVLPVWAALFNLPPPPPVDLLR
jgi:hypothetical protein